MNSNFDLCKELCSMRSAKLHVFVALLLCGRSVSVRDLCKATGYSDKPVTAALHWLMDRQVVTRTGRSGFALKGENYQLPLSWDERIEGAEIPADRYSLEEPTSDRDLAVRVAALEESVNRLVSVVSGQWSGSGEHGTRDKGQGRDSETGDFPIYPGDIPEVKGPWASELWSVGSSPRTDSGDETGDFPVQSGDFPESNESEAGVQGSVAREQWAGGDSETGDFPVYPGDFPIHSGDFPESDHSGVKVNNLNILTNKVSKQVNKDTCLVNDHNKGDRSLTAAGEIPECDAKSAWKMAMSQMKMQMDKAAFSTMLGSAVLLGYTDELFTVGMTNGFTRDWAEQRLTGTLERILSTVYNHPQRVSFVVVSQEEHEVLRAEESKAEQRDEKRPDYLQLPERELYEGERRNVELCNAYLDEPIGIKYSKEELEKLLSKRPDPELLRFVLPRAKSFRAAQKYIGSGVKAAKLNLLWQLGCGGPLQKQIGDDANASLWLIDYWYWRFRTDEAFDYEQDKALMLTKILNGDDREYAEDGERPVRQYLKCERED